MTTTRKRDAGQVTAIMKGQLDAADGLFQQMNEHKIPADPAVFTMFGIMLGALKALQCSDRQSATEAQHHIAEVAELDRIDQVATDRTETEIADWVSDELDIGKNAHMEKIRIVEGIRNRLWKETP